MLDDWEQRRSERLKRRNALLTHYDLADRLDVMPGTILKWARQGKIPVIRFSRKVIRFDYDGLVAALRKKAAAKFASQPHAILRGNGGQAVRAYWRASRLSNRRDFQSRGAVPPTPPPVLSAEGAPARMSVFTTFGSQCE